MPPVNSTMLELGTPAPDFSLEAPDGSSHDLAACMGTSGLLVTFICNHCPFVKHIGEELARLGEELPAQDIGMVGIMSNDTERYPDDAPAKMLEAAATYGWSFPYLFDATQEVAKAYHAACTPDFFLFDGDGKLVYRGQLDDSRPDSGIPVDGRDLRDAVTSLLGGDPPAANQKPALGCGIKWVPGNEPAYVSAST